MIDARVQVAFRCDNNMHGHSLASHFVGHMIVLGMRPMVCVQYQGLSFICHWVSELGGYSVLLWGCCGYTGSLTGHVLWWNVTTTLLRVSRSGKKCMCPHSYNDMSAHAVVW